MPAWIEFLPPFLDIFPSCSVRHLVRSGSDHNPLQISLTNTYFKPFRFEYFWYESPELPSLVTRAFDLHVSHPDASPPEVFTSKLSTLQSLLSLWNWTRFGHIETNIREIEAKIKMSEDATSSSPLELRSLYNQHKVLLRQLNIKWSSKARQMWLNYSKGDSNTRYFHRLTAIRRRTNLITSLVSPSGEVMEDADSIAQAFTNFYQDLWAPSNSYQNEGNWHNSWLPFLCYADIQDLSDIPSNLEILKAVQGLPNGKAPGPDGYQMEFYRNTWNITGSYVCSAMPILL